MPVDDAVDLRTVYGDRRIERRRIHILDVACKSASKIQSEAENDESDQRLRRSADILGRNLVHVDEADREEEDIAEAVQRQRGDDDPRDRQECKNRIPDRPGNDSEHKALANSDPRKDKRQREHHADLGDLRDTHDERKRRLGNAHTMVLRRRAEELAGKDVVELKLGTDDERDDHEDEKVPIPKERECLHKRERVRTFTLWRRGRQREREEPEDDREDSGKIEDISRNRMTGRRAPRGEDPTGENPADRPTDADAPKVALRAC